jgi:hypothetical protein
MQGLFQPKRMSIDMKVATRSMTLSVLADACLAARFGRAAIRWWGMAEAKKLNSTLLRHKITTLIQKPA